jgi:predicted membrane protein
MSSVAGITIGPVHKKDVLRANVMNEKKGENGRSLKKFAVILAFDVQVGSFWAASVFSCMMSSARLPVKWLLIARCIASTV